MPEPPEPTADREQPGHTVGGAALTEAVLQVMHAFGLLAEHGDRITAQFGQSPARWQVLGALEEQPRTVPQIGRRMGLTRQSCQRTANLLAEDGLVAFIDNPDHATSSLVALTPVGRRTLERINAAQATWINALAEQYSPRQLETLRRALARMIDVLARDDGIDG